MLSYKGDITVDAVSLEAPGRAAVKTRETRSEEIDDASLVLS